MDAFFATVQKACLPGVWSKGVAFSRDHAVLLDSKSHDEIHVRIREGNRPVSPKVTLWPKEGDWYCDCGDRNDPCAHVAAAVIAWKAGDLEPEALAARSRPSASLHYSFRRVDGALQIERWIMHDSHKQALEGSLVSYVAGIQSGRVQAPPLAVTQEDYAVDQILASSPRTLLQPPATSHLLAKLEGHPRLDLDGKPINASAKPAVLRAVLTDADSGFRLFLERHPRTDEIFCNGVALCEGTLRPISTHGLSPQEIAMLESPGREYAPGDAARLVAEILPALESKLQVEVRSSRLPRLVETLPRVLLQAQKLDESTLSVLPLLIYGDPPFAEVRNGELRSNQPDRVPIRNPDAERALVKKLRDELHLVCGQPARFEGEAAARFTEMAKGWDLTGSSIQDFGVAGELRPRILAQDRRFDLGFELEGKHASTEAVFRSWREGSGLVPLLEGGWAKLPSAWMSTHGERILELLEARDSRGELPAYRAPEIARLCEELGQEPPPGLKMLRDSLGDFEGIPPATLPDDLTAQLRGYQRRGVDWLVFLREHSMGALLADDMGLGKTLQALCAIQGKTLIVCPTSVLQAWSDQIQKFRPGLSVSLYYGPNRLMSDQAEVVLTTYGLLRQDREVFVDREWGTIILDEAQTIKNPSSQVAQAAHQLRSRFRIALSGTPIENRLDDLWSQFQFVCPGLLGTRERFSEQASGGTGLQLLRDRIRPFVLRRLKREVAHELPPRTETVLHGELTQEERAVYEAILASTRAEILNALQSGGSVLSALEALLRLRQACCHPALVPGSGGSTPNGSSKVRLLLEQLDESVAQGHRSLVFSQWTSFLDLIAPELRNRGLSHLRLDGSTPNRGEIVRKFQSQEGPPILLMSLKAGGVGLTLTAADHVFLLDPWWNPAAEDQAADRAHRIGQNNPVLIHRLIARETVEEKILELQLKKRDLAKAILEGAEAAASLTREDLIALLGTN